MRVPFCWLKDYVEITESAQEVAELLQAVGVPVENIEREGAEVSGVVSARVESVEQHPDAERLKVCQVEAGSQRLQIVTAAPNVRAGMVTALALHGAVLADGVKIKRGKLRGALSEGMFCGASEIGYDPELLPAEDREGILNLAADTPLGRPIQEVLPLQEEILIVESFANRADQLSILGIARELAAKLRRPLRLPAICQDFRPEDINPSQNSELVTIEDYEACPRFMARLISEVKVGPSPRWMAHRLELAGMRSINNVVDITNYVMLETGQPLHAYDRAHLAGGGLIVRRAQPGEKLTTLDGTEQTLPDSAIVIADAQRGVGVAGVMGGLNSEVEETTKELFLESAAFDNALVRRTALRLGLRTESSKRFEKGIDLERVIFGAQRAAYLLGQLAGRVEPTIVVKSVPTPAPQTVALRTHTLQRLLGLEFTSAQIVEILGALDFQVRQLEEGLFQVQVPSFRLDISQEVDLVEEIARHYGYDNLPCTVPAVQVGAVTYHTDAPEEHFRSLALSLGLTEIITPSLSSGELLRQFRLQEDKCLQIMNPLSEDQRVLRSHLFPFMTNAVLRNLRLRNEDLRFFEISHIYRPSKQAAEGVREPRRLGIALSFAGADFFNLKGIVESLGRSLRLELSFKRETLPWAHSGCCAGVYCGETRLGWLGAVHPQLARELDLEQPLLWAELDIDRMWELKGAAQYRKRSRFPAVERDLALVVDSQVSAGELLNSFRKVGGALMVEAKCFDVYTGAPIPAGQKSMAFRFVLQSMEKTLTEDEINKLLKKLQKAAEREFKATLRE